MFVVPPLALLCDSLRFLLRRRPPRARQRRQEFLVVQKLSREKSRLERGLRGRCDFSSSPFSPYFPFDQDTFFPNFLLFVGFLLVFLANIFPLAFPILANNSKKYPDDSITLELVFRARSRAAASLPPSFATSREPPRAPTSSASSSKWRSAPHFFRLSHSPSLRRVGPHRCTS